MITSHVEIHTCAWYDAREVRTLTNTRPILRKAKNISITDEERRTLWALGVLYSDTETGILVRGMNQLVEALSAQDRDKLNRLIAIREQTQGRD